jgi:hypothetical protein
VPEPTWSPSRDDSRATQPVLIQKV